MFERENMNLPKSKFVPEPVIVQSFNGKLVYTHNGVVKEVPGGAPHGFGLMVGGKYIRVGVGDDIREILEKI
jgi:hypothetical protein